MTGFSRPSFYEKNQVDGTAYTTKLEIYIIPVLIPPRAHTVLGSPP